MFEMRDGGCLLLCVRERDVREQGGKSPSRDYDISTSPSFDERGVSVPLEEFSEAVNGSGNWKW